MFYLFYGDIFPLDALSHRLLVNCILSIKEHGFESMAMCLNNTDYYGTGKMILNPEKIANTAKATVIDPKIVSKNLFTQTAYNSQHQRQIANEVSELIQNNENIKLVVINNLTKFFKDSSGHNRSEIANSLKEVISVINRACAKNKVSLVITGDSNLSSKGVIPRPIGGTYLKHPDGTSPDPSTGLCADGSQPQSQNATTAGAAPLSQGEQPLVCADGSIPDSATSLCADGIQPQP